MTNASFGVVSYVFKSVLGIERQKKPLKKMQFWPGSLGAKLEYWYIELGLLTKTKKQQKCFVNQLALSSTSFRDKSGKGLY